jgi:sugar transferase (PEP-CTERM system associated)
VIRIFSQYVSVKSLLLMFLESCLVVLSLLCAVKLRFWNDEAELALYVTFPDFAAQIAIVVAVCLACFYYNDLYDLSAGTNPVERVLRIEQSIGAACLLLGLTYFLFPNLLLSRGVFIIGMILVTAFVLLARKILDRAWRLTSPLQRVAILGTGPLAMELAKELIRRQDLGMRLTGFISASPTEADQHFGFPVLGAVGALSQIAKHLSISRIIVALEDRRGVLPTRELVTLRVHGIRVDDAPTALSALTGRISLRAVQPSWFVFSDGFHRSRWNDLLKRILDLVVGMIGLVVCLPLMILAAMAVWLDSRGPIIYRQTRVGRMGKHFDVWKFRSMKVGAENGTGAQWARENDPRTTRVGGFLRRYRLDELPQFLNVIWGEMSFVGPRPERPEFVDKLRQQIPYYDERHSVRPGITGWAQVQYQYGSSVEDAKRKLEYDLFYLQNMSILFDCAIIFKTTRIVLTGSGAR